VYIEERGLSTRMTKVKFAVSLLFNRGYIVAEFEQIKVLKKLEQQDIIINVLVNFI